MAVENFRQNPMKTAMFMNLENITSIYETNQ